MLLKMLLLRHRAKLITNLVKSYRKYSTANKYELDLKLNNVSLNNYLKTIQEEYQKICDGNVQKTSQWEHVFLVGKLLEKRSGVLDNLTNLSDLLKDDDEEMKKLASEELKVLESEVKNLDNEILNALIPVDEDDYDAIVLEVFSGVGGQEAMLFAKELFDMYTNFIAYKGWELEIADLQTTELGGLRHASVLVNGPSVFKYFKHEAGVHRVQRTPTTEKSGRIHTSTASVIALPQPTDIEININPKDLKIETKRSTGAGGQHVNTTDSAVRVTHLPTGTAVECQVDRSQIKNRKIALAKLNALLYQKELDKQVVESEATRKSQVKSNFRNEKIRTYNFNQDRITDHRLQGVHVHNLKNFLLGGKDLENLIDELDYSNRVVNLLEIVDKYNK